MKTVNRTYKEYVKKYYWVTEMKIIMKSHTYALIR